jgi:hypothetical protein
MTHRRKVEWTRLDNASKYFAATSSDRDTKVFRLTCELYEAVDPEILQKALDLTVESFPLYKSVLRRGFFWYYLETSDIKPTVQIESNPVCAPIYLRDRRNLLFRTFYYNNRINLEVFHSLSDGTGALWFMQTLVHHYLVLKHGHDMGGKIPELNYSAPMSKKMDDSFSRFYTGKGAHKEKNGDNEKEKGVTAYHLRGTRLEENRIKLIEGSMSVKAVLELAHEFNATLTVFIASLFIYSIYKEMPSRVKNRPVVLSIPINLRQFFESVTARNFFSTMKVGYFFDKNRDDLESIVEKVNDSFRRELTEENLNMQLNRFMALEKNILARIVPLPFKDYFIRAANKLNDRGITAALSNIGRINMPAEFDAYIREFSVCTSVRRPQICMCSYGDRLVISFTSPYRETDIQRTFFQFLAKKGIEIEISSNI